MHGDAGIVVYTSVNDRLFLQRLKAIIFGFYVRHNPKRFRSMLLHTS
jgi:hypothetical protein